MRRILTNTYRPDIQANQRRLQLALKFRVKGFNPAFAPLRPESFVSTNKFAAVSDWERLAKEADFDLGRMASLCGISDRHLQRIFKKHIGYSPAKWLRGVQCRLAKDLIMSGYSSKAAAAELKFSTGAHFCREFKRFFGASPQTFAPGMRRFNDG